MSSAPESNEDMKGFTDALIGETNRVLGMLDRDTNSRTFGSIDRVHWAWKFTDFPGARFLISTRPSASVFKTPVPNTFTVPSGL